MDDLGVPPIYGDIHILFWVSSKAPDLAEISEQLQQTSINFNQLPETLLVPFSEWVVVNHMPFPIA
jgi:hypothetical protein